MLKDLLAERKARNSGYAACKWEPTYEPRLRLWLWLALPLSGDRRKWKALDQKIDAVRRTGNTDYGVHREAFRDASVSDEELLDSFKRTYEV